MKRTFESGAIRDTAKGKADYFGIRHPLVEKSFADFIVKHSYMPDGTYRSTGNWWKGWSKEISLQSAIRHLEDLQAIEAGLYVYEIRYKDGTVKKEYRNKENILKDLLEDNKNIECVNQIDFEESANAIRFNVCAYLLERLK